MKQMSESLVPAIQIVEDDPLYSNELLLDIGERFGERVRLLPPITSEVEFERRFEEMTSAGALRLLLLDIMVRWARPEDNTARSQEVNENGYYKAGGRCLRKIRRDARTEGLPVILHSNLSEEAAWKMVKELSIDRAHTEFVPKSGSAEALLEAIERLLF